MDEGQLTNQNLQEIVNNLCEAHGVTPMELYMRQNGLCWLEIVDGVLYCTDGKEHHPTSGLENPTAECSRCLSCFVEASVNVK